MNSVNVYFVLAALCLAFVQGNEKKYGCLITPNICTPPEDCSDDGLLGSCQVPDPPEWDSYEEEPYLGVIRDLQNLGRSVNYEAIEDALKLRKNYFEEVEREELYNDAKRLFDLLSQIDAWQRTRKIDEKISRERFIDNSRGYDTAIHPEFRRSTGVVDRVNFQENINDKRLRSYVNSVVKSLNQHGYEVSDFKGDNFDELARLLAKDYLQHDQSEDETKEEMKEDENKSREEIKARPVGAGRESAGRNVESKKDVAVKKEVAHDSKPVELDEEDNDKVDHVMIPKVKNADNILYAVSEPAQPQKKNDKNRTLYLVIIVVGATVLLIIVVTILTCCIQAYWEKERKKLKGDIASSTVTPMDDDYQELCRQHYASKNSEHTINQKDVVLDSPVKEPLITRAFHLQKPIYPDVANHEGTSKGDLRNHSANAATRNSSVSSTSWSEEPVTASLDITTGHAVLSYMEDHLHNKDRLEKEWEEICKYEADEIKAKVASNAQNARKNRTGAALPYDHNRVKLNEEKNQMQNDYINASMIIDNDPKRPLYIATQGPLPSTIPDFWQMMWEQECVAIVMLTPLVEEGVNQCARYWPDEGSCTYHKFEIHLVSEHIWCEDYLVRSLYLKNLETGDTRTVTQFHFLSWPNGYIPTTPKPLLELRRKVTKCYKGHNSPVLVHCSDGVGRTGTYILLDLAIDRMLKGAKEIDIAATLEHIRDQRSGMVGTKEQFEFALTAVAEEVNAILKSLLH